MRLFAFAAVIASAFAASHDERGSKPSCSVNCSKVQSRCAKPTQKASVTKFCSAYLSLPGGGSGGRQSTVFTTVTSTITSTTTNFPTATSTAAAQTVTASTTLYAEVTSIVASTTTTVYTSTITGTDTVTVNAPDITKCAMPNLSNAKEKREPAAERKCREKKPHCLRRQHRHEEITSACKCFSITPGPGNPGNGAAVTSTVTSFTTTWSTVQSGAIVTVTPTSTSLVKTTSTSTKSITSTSTIRTISTASRTSTRYAIATAAYKTSPFRILASGGTVTGKYLITPNPAGTDYFSNALLVFQGNTTSQATPFTWKDDAPIAPNGYPPTILSSGSADKLRAADFPNQDEESITCTVVGGPGNTCVLQCQNPFDGGRESFEDCYQQDRNWMVGIRAGVDYSSCPLVLPYVVTI